MLSGNLGNLINVIINNGNGTDWIVTENYIAFNLADAYLLVGLCLITKQLFDWLFTGEVKQKLQEILMR